MSNHFKSIYSQLRKHRKLAIFALCMIPYLLLCFILYPLPLPTASSSNSAPTPYSVVYHGGIVQTLPTSYLIFWGSGWQQNGRLNATGQLLESYFSHVGGTSYEQVLTEYYMLNKHGSRSYVANTERFSDAQVWLDITNPTPDNNNCGGPTIEDAAIQKEVARAIHSQHWPQDSRNTTYFVYTSQPYFVEELGFGCSDQDICADHEWSPTLSVAYAVLPYPKRKFCEWASENAYSLVLFSAHEQFEAITDPNAPRADDLTDTNHGWYYRGKDGYLLEIGDICANQRGLRVLHGVTFLLQSIWSIRQQQCI